MDCSTLEQLRDEFEAFKAGNRAEIDALKAQFAALEASHRAAARRSRRRLAAATLVAGLAIAWASTPEARAQFGLTLTGLNTRLMAVEAKTAPLSLNGTTLTISGVNVQVVDGSGATDSTSGLGNLTVGYNQLRVLGGDLRTGSHNLIVGDNNNYTSYGGLVVGAENEIDGAYASVSGGVANTASGVFSSVSGGNDNTASSAYASVSGGTANLASGPYASVSGGNLNVASGLAASVSGGFSRSAVNNFNWAAGGLLQPN